MTTITPGQTIELTYDELHAAQDLASLSIEVRVHFTNWPGTPSVPARVLPHADPDGNVELELSRSLEPRGQAEDRHVLRQLDSRDGARTAKLFAMPDELTTTPRAGLEVRPARST
jgi:hypothetical protein